MHQVVSCFMICAAGLSLLLQPAVAEEGSHPAVVRAQFTTLVDHREPVDDVTFLPQAIDQIVFFTELRGLAGHTIRHRWVYDGKPVREMAFEIKANQWRTWSNKRMIASKSGRWMVEVIDDAGQILARRVFSYLVAPQAGMASSPLFDGQNFR